MNKNVILTLCATSFLALTSCGLKTKTSKENFLKKAEQTTEYAYTYARVKCKGKSESSEWSDTSVQRNTIDRYIIYVKNGSTWFVSSDNEKLTDFEKEVSTTIKKLLSTTVKSAVKKEPISDDTNTGLTYYVNPLSYRYKVKYDNNLTKVNFSGTTANARVSGKSTEIYEYENTSGCLTYYYENSDLTFGVTYQSKNLIIDSIVKMEMKITYSDEKFEK